MAIERLGQDDRSRVQFLVTLSTHCENEAGRRAGGEAGEEAQIDTDK